MSGASFLPGARVKMPKPARKSPEKPSPGPTFEPTPDVCNEPIRPGQWCEHPWPCPVHGGDAA